MHAITKHSTKLSQDTNVKSQDFGKPQVMEMVIPIKGVIASKRARLSLPEGNGISSCGQILLQSPTHHHHQIYPQDGTSKALAQATCISVQ
jgi:hypothetical protein